MKLTSILIVDDIESVRSQVLEEFKVQGVNVLQASGQAELEEHLKYPFEFQMIVLDWLLDDENSILAKLCLQKIREKYFVPVMIWTEQLGRFEDEAEEVKKTFPEVCLMARSKAKVGVKDLLDFLEQWYATTPAKLSSQFRHSIAVSVEESLYRLAEHSEDDLARGLKTLISLGERDEIDVEHAVDILLRLVGRAISTDESFIEAVHQTVAKLEHPPTTKKTRDIESRIKKLHMYYYPSDNDKIVRAGDIVDITIEVGNQPKVLKGVVLTPACDLARPRTAFLRLALVNEKTTTNKSGDDKWSLPFLQEGKLFEVCFHEVLVVKNETWTSNDVPDQPKPVMLYTHTYQTLNGANVVLKRECRLDEPYRADLLHSFSSHASRIGLPEFTAT